MGIICGVTESEDLTILTCFYVQMLGLDYKMREEREIKGCSEKRKQDGMQLIRYPFSYMDIQTTLLYCLYIYRYKVK